MTTVLLVDDHQIVRDGLRLCLKGCAGYEVVGEAADGATAIRLARELRPDCIVTDVAMPGLSGIEVTRKILASAHCQAKIICLSMHADREIVAEALQAGAVGYLLKSAAFQELIHALEVVQAGGIYVSPAVAAAAAVDGLVDGPLEGGNELLAFLTVREKQVLQLLVAGNSARQIGMILGISHKTVYSFRTQIMAKLGIDNLPDLTKFAIRQGVAELE